MNTLASQAESADPTPRSRTLVGLTLVGWLAVLGAWAAVSGTQLSVIVPSPVETYKALVELAKGTLWSELRITGWRATQGTAAAIAMGTTVGIVTGSSQKASALLKPARSILTGLPPIITVVLVTIWAGLDGDAAPTIVAISTMPMIWITTSEAVIAVDPELNEMTAGLNVKWHWKLRHLTLPAIAAPVRAVGAYVAATSLRLTIMAELLSEPDGIGAAIARSRTMLNTPDVFAWTLVAVAGAMILERVAIKSGGTRWRPQGT